MSFIAKGMLLYLLRAYSHLFSYAFADFFVCLFECLHTCTAFQFMPSTYNRNQFKNKCSLSKHNPLALLGIQLASSILSLVGITQEGHLTALPLSLTSD